MDIKIKGLENSDARYAILKRNLQDIGASYGMKDIKIDVDVLQKGIYPDAQTLLRKSLRIPIIVLDLTEDELKPILAHEFSHLFNQDNIVQYSIFLSIVIPPLIVLYNIFPYVFEKISLFLGLCISIFVFLIILGYGFKIMNWVSNKHEIRADRDALLKTRNPEAMLNAFLKLRNHASLTSEKRPSFLIRKFESVYHYFCGFTHPSWEERIEKIKFYKKNLIL